MSVMRGMLKMVDPFLDWAAVRYQSAVGTELKKYGLRYDDLYDQLSSLETAQALERLPLETLDARAQRLKRAIDLSGKHTYLSKEMQAKQTPFAYYVQDSYAEVQSENLERMVLGTSGPRDRSLP